MFCRLITSIFKIFNEINDFKEIQSGGFKMTDGSYFDVKDVIMTSLLLLMITKLLSCTRLLSDMLLQRRCGYTSNREELLIK